MLQDGLNSYLQPLGSACASKGQHFQLLAGEQASAITHKLCTRSGFHGSKSCAPCTKSLQIYIHDLRKPKLLAHSIATQLHKFSSVPGFSKFKHHYFPFPKLCFTFPIWYFFTIGLGQIFSFRSNVPPTSHTNAKRCNSKKMYHAWRHADDRQENHPCPCHFSKAYSCTSLGSTSQHYNLEQRTPISTLSFTLCIRHY